MHDGKIIDAVTLTDERTSAPWRLQLLHVDKSLNEAAVGNYNPKSIPKRRDWWQVAALLLAQTKGGAILSWSAYLHALDNMLPGQALVIDTLASPEDLCGNHIVRTLPAQLLQYEVGISELTKLTVAP